MDVTLLLLNTKTAIAALQNCYCRRQPARVAEDSGWHVYVLMIISECVHLLVYPTALAVGRARHINC